MFRKKEAENFGQAHGLVYLERKKWQDLQKQTKDHPT
jgi:hypothetical protein